MYFLYVDESGDIGMQNSPTNYFVLSGFVVHELKWHDTLESIINFRKSLSHKNFPGPQNPQDYGILIVDQADEPKLRLLTRQMRRYNPVPSMYTKATLEIPITTLVEDAVHRNSLHSYFIQLADVNAFFLYQKHAPCRYVKKKGAKNYFHRLDPILCKVASRSDCYGIVYR